MSTTDIESTVATQLEAYHASRAALIAQEKALRHDYAFRQRLSETAKRASNIVGNIRHYEAATVWTKEVEDDEGDVYPGMMFTLAKDRMESTRLWKIVKRMPKGCLLHAHLEAMVDMDWLLNLALETPGLHIFSDIPLVSPEALRIATIQFQYSPEPPAVATSLYSSAYVPNGFVPITEAADTFPANLLMGSEGTGTTSREAFLEWLIDRTTITAEESLKHHEGINMVWRKFQGIFRIISGIVYYEPVYRAFVRHILHHLHLDNVLWVDMRAAYAMTFRAANTGEILPRTDVIRAFSEEVERYKKSPEGAGFWGARMIWTTIRSFDNETIRASMKECVEAKKLYPHAIAGFDLVGQEDLGRPHKELIPEILWFREYCRQEAVDIPFFFHAGETLGDGNATDENLFDAILLGTKRIGHGFSLYKHPHLLRLCRERKICLEVCPVSNEILRLTSSILSHSLPALLAHGVPVTLNNDDPGILGQKTTASMTHDHWQVLQAFDNVGLEGLGDLAETTVRYAAFEGVDVGVEEGVREERMKMWKSDWEKFCEWVVADFGEWEEGEGA
ncbi:Metallo-dependent hydrolase [Morchella conica CCBAS932]|uniref:adenosine deaminase n=1 Tax=Morchella conica CCBAS932 TaxID=1392247 RepID=A0A3N4KCJ6_9PEZI|nr:Metallo-dependent hydrolase [Morchella conica CCBAS932]